MLSPFLCRLQGVTIVKPIVFGNVARYFGKKREEDGHTHQWSVYVKPYRNEVRGTQQGARKSGIYLGKTYKQCCWKRQIDIVLPGYVCLCEEDPVQAT